MITSNPFFQLLNNITKDGVEKSTQKTKKKKVDVVKIDDTADWENETLLWDYIQEQESSKKKKKKPKSKSKSKRTIEYKNDQLIEGEQKEEKEEEEQKEEQTEQKEEKEESSEKEISEDEEYWDKVEDFYRIDPNKDIVDRSKFFGSISPLLFIGDKYNYNNTFVIDFLNIFNVYLEEKYYNTDIDFKDISNLTAEYQVNSFFDMFFNQYIKNYSFMYPDDTFLFVSKQKNSFTSAFHNNAKKYRNIRFIVITDKYKEKELDRNKDDFLCQYIYDYLTTKGYKTYLLTYDKYRDTEDYLDSFIQLGKINVNVIPKIQYPEVQMFTAVSKQSNKSIQIPIRIDELDQEQSILLGITDLSKNRKKNIQLIREMIDKNKQSCNTSGNKDDIECRYKDYEICDISEKKCVPYISDTSVNKNIRDKVNDKIKTRIKIYGKTLITGNEKDLIEFK